MINGTAMKNLRHLTIHLGKIRRSRGESFAAKLAYITRSAVENPRTGRTHDYSARAAEVVATRMVNWYGDSASLVEEATFAERRRDACEGREIIVALPEELDDDTNLKLLETCAGYFVGEYGVAAVLALHRAPTKGSRLNKHGHVVITARMADEGRKLGAKTRILDSLKTGGPEVRKFRSWWSATLNFALRARGLNANIEHRSFEELGIRALPTKHQGVGRTAARRNREVAVAAVAAEFQPKGHSMRKLPTPQPKPILTVQAHEAGASSILNHLAAVETAMKEAPKEHSGLQSEPTPSTPAPGRPPLPIPRIAPALEPTL